MKYLEELEAKVLGIIAKNNELAVKSSELKNENERLLTRCIQLEEALITKDKSSENLETEKNLIRDSISDLLESISSLEEKNKEVIK